MSILLWVITAAAAVAFVAVTWWGTSGPPTRPRPRSRYRGPTFTEVDRKLRRRMRR